MTTIRCVLLWALCAVGVANAVAQNRTLDWDSLTVDARLDAQGVLHVTERHAMVFDGAWNGGERIFQVRSWQRLNVTGLSEIEPATGASVPWIEGNLSQVGRFQRDGNVLRWRARMPSDPPFQHARKTYEIRYSLAGVVIPEGDTYRLEHDLAFPNRSGEIRAFDATLAIDPSWQVDGTPLQWHHENLQPGESVFVNASLRYLGVGRPQAVASAIGAGSTIGVAPQENVSWWSVALVAALTAFAIAHAIALLRRERDRGRFEPLLPPDRIDEAWLNANVFNRPPEVVGAAWDLETSASEVAALLARLQQQGALQSQVITQGMGWLKRETLHMELLCERDRLAEHEHMLIDSLFMPGSMTTDTERIRRRYANKGFNPAEVIERGIERQLPVVFADKLAVPPWARWSTVLLAVAALASFIGSALQAPDAAHFIVVASAVLLGVSVLGLVFAYVYRRSVVGLASKLAVVFGCVGVLCGAIVFVLIGGAIPLAPLGALSLALVGATFVNMIFNTMRTRETPEASALRRQLAAGRAYFERELKSAKPRLDDEWFPYLLAFGLGPRIDRWFKSFGGEHARRGLGASVGTGASTDASRSASSAWTGGGGAFGGAGASGSWASAVGKIAAGVAKSSSSGGSSGGGRSRGGGSSRSSGGGGGGGW